MSTGNGTILARASPPTLDNADKQIKQTPDKQAVLQTVSVMKNKRTTYEKRWKSIRDYQLPFLGVFSDTADETDRGRRRDTEIANGVAWLSNQAFAAGVMSGLTPPSRQWFKFGFSDGTEGDVEAFAGGLVLGDGTVCLPAKLEPLGPGESLVTICEGKYHQVRRMLASRGMPVTYLERRAEGQLTLDGVPRGHFRVLSQAERHLLSSGGETLSFGHFL